MAEFWAKVVVETTYYVKVQAKDVDDAESLALESIPEDEAPDDVNHWVEVRQHLWQFGKRSAARAAAHEGAER